jgi:hypothetical protein
MEASIFLAYKESQLHRRAKYDAIESDTTPGVSGLEP